MSYPIDTFRDAFLKFLSEGMTYREAHEQFDPQEFQRAAMEELDSGMTRALTVWDGIEKAGNIVTNDERELSSLFDLLVKANFERSNSVDSYDYQQALDLWQAGWTSEIEQPKGNSFWHQVPVMSWYWRAPSKRLGRSGRLYRSTNQAWNAMKKKEGAK